MLQSIPLTVEVTMERRQIVVVDGERKIPLDPHPQTHTIQLERDGRPLTVADRLPSYVPGEREGWREWPGCDPKPKVSTVNDWPDEYVIEDAEEIHDADG